MLTTIELLQKMLFLNQVHHRCSNLQLNPHVQLQNVTICNKCNWRIYDPKFSHFLADFWKIWQNHTLPHPTPILQGWHPLLWGILDPPLSIITVFCFFL